MEDKKKKKKDDILKAQVIGANSTKEAMGKSKEVFDYAKKTGKAAESAAENMQKAPAFDRASRYGRFTDHASRASVKLQSKKVESTNASLTGVRDVLAVGLVEALRPDEGDAADLPEEEMEKREEYNLDRLRKKKMLESIR